MTKMKMNPEIKEQWLSALRSGNYKQGTEALCTDDRYCCLGVLTDLAAKQGVTRWLDEVEVNLEGESSYREDPLPNETVVKWAGLPDDNPTVEYVGFARTLAELNDDVLCTFDEIADAIERDL